MSLVPTYEVHSHYAADGKPRDITARVVKGSWTRGDAITGYGGGSFTFKLALPEIQQLVNVGDWVVPRDPAGTAYELLHVDDVDYDISIATSGAVSITGKATLSTWPAFLARAQVFVPPGRLVEPIGMVYDLLSWFSATLAGFKQYLLGASLGDALRLAFKALSNIRLPASLGGETLGEAIPVVFDEATAVQFAPELRATIDPILDVSGLPDNVSWNFMKEGPITALNRMFVPERSLVRLQPYTAYEAPGEAPLSKLAAALKCRPVLTYGYLPWRTQPLQDSALTYADFKRTDTAVNAGRVVNAVSAVLGGPQIAQEDLPFTSDTDLARARQAAALSSRFNKVTWSNETAKEIPPKAFRGGNISYHDEDRVNVTAITLSLTPGQGIEAWPQNGLPLINRQSVENHGPRVLSPEWPFVRRTREEGGFFDKVLDGDFLLDLRSIAAQAMQFNVNAHKLGRGTIRFNPMDVLINRTGPEPGRTPWGVPRRLLHLCAGDVFKFRVAEGTVPFTAYAHAVTHEWTRTDDSGAATMNASVAFSRATLDTDLLAQRGKVPVDMGIPAASRPKLTRNPALRSSPRPDTVFGEQSTPNLLADNKEYPTDIQFTRNLLVFGPNLPASYYVNRVAGGTFAAPANNAGRPVKSVIVHYNDGGLRSTAHSLRNYFQGKHDGFPATNPINSHFAINPNGSITQMLDAAVYGFHAEDCNAYTVGIDLICPFTLSVRKKASNIVAETSPAERLRLTPWNVETDTWTIISANGRRVTFTDFFSYSLPQLTSLGRLLYWLNNHFGFVLHHDINTGESIKGWKRFSPGDGIARLIDGGVYHHGQFNSGRVDSLGVDLNAAVALALSYLRSR